MTAQDLLAQLEGSGFVVRVEGKSLIVSPATKLNDSMRELIGIHKPRLVELIEARPYVGWWRRTPKCRWQSVVRGSSERDAMNRLLTYTPGRGHAEIIVLPAGSHPKDKT